MSGVEPLELSKFEFVDFYNERLLVLNDDRLELGFKDGTNSHYFLFSSEQEEILLKCLLARKMEQDASGA